MLEIDNEVLDINQRLYWYLKDLNPSNKTFSKRQMSEVIGLIFPIEETDFDLDLIQNKLISLVELEKGARRENLENIVGGITNHQGFTCFRLALLLVRFTQPLLDRAKSLDNFVDVELARISKLSIKFDNIGLNSAYFVRAKAALLVKKFFEKLDAEDMAYVREIAASAADRILSDYQYLKKHNLEIERMFLVMFIQSVNQSIVSRAGSSLESVIKDILIINGVTESSILKSHDSKNKSLEFDFFFPLGGKNYGISAKRTFRERYKQFSKAEGDADIFIQVTLGLDLNEEKMEIIRSGGVYIFVADEIYDAHEYLQNREGVYPGREFTLATLERLE